MKKYTKPAMQVVELSVKESLSALPFAFNRMVKTGSAGKYNLKNVTVLTRTSNVDA